MSKFPKLLTATAALTLAAAPAFADTFGLGRVALPEEITAWDLDVSPDGTGLPVGSGNVMDGDDLFQENCAVCHGVFAEGSGNWPELAGGVGTLADDDPVKTVGSYWPHLSTAWDYVNRSMPFGNAQSLNPDEVYAIVAYMLYSNDLVDDDFTLSNENFLDVAMPNADGFIVDDREATEYPIWRAEPCMENCKDTVEITMRARVLDVTPETDTPAAQTETVTAAAAEAPPRRQPRHRPRRRSRRSIPRWWPRARRSSRNAPPAIRSAKAPRTAPARISTASLAGSSAASRISVIPRGSTPCATKDVSGTKPAWPNSSPRRRPISRATRCPFPV